MLYQGYRILRYTRSGRWKPSRIPGQERQLSLLIANVLFRNRRTEPLLNLVRATNPDVLLAVETEHFWSTRSPA